MGQRARARDCAHACGRARRCHGKDAAHGTSRGAGETRTQDDHASQPTRRVRGDVSGAGDGGGVVPPPWQRSETGRWRTRRGQGRGPGEGFWRTRLGQWEVGLQSFRCWRIFRITSLCVRAAMIRSAPADRTGSAPSPAQTRASAVVPSSSAATRVRRLILHALLARDHRPTPVAVRRQTAAIAHQVDAWQGHEGCQLLHEFHGREPHPRGAIGPGMGEGVDEIAVGVLSGAPGTPRRGRAYRIRRIELQTLFCHRAAGGAIPGVDHNEGGSF